MINVCVHVREYVYVHGRVCVRACVYVCSGVYMCAFVHDRVHVCVSVHARICVSVRANEGICVRVCSRILKPART